MTTQLSIDEILNSLSLEEKAQLCVGKDFWRVHGIERLGLPAAMVADGPNGLRKQPDGADHMGLQRSIPATCFPTAAGLAATWNPELLQQMGVALGEECRAQDISVLLGPGVNMKRHPLGGRNFEYYSEDPYLAGQLATGWINGVQSQGVGTSMKHYAVNNHEYGRMSVDAIVDERTLREIYLPAFETTVKEAQPWTIMCAYNKLNGEYLAENRLMLTEILRDEWQYEGMVVTDWGANNDRVAGVKAGQNLEMPASGEVNVNKIIAAVNSGELTMAELDNSVRHVVQLLLRAKASFDDDHPRQADLEQNHELARKVAEQAAVLLKNEPVAQENFSDVRPLLPIKAGQKILVVGSLAKQTRYQGSGSSQINPFKLEQPLDELKKLVPEADIEFVEGYSLKGDFTYVQRLEAQSAAKRADVIVVFAGLTPEFESEGFDRQHMNLPLQQRDLLNALKPEHHKVVLVLQNGAPVIIPNLETIPAVLEGYLGGQAGASALANLLLGKANPSGKLAETFPISESDCASHNWFPGSHRQSQYREGIWIGYRYFDSADIATQFPFGHGLSYSQFEYNDLNLSGDSLLEGEQISITCTLTNSSEVAGFETAQLYIGQQNPSQPRPKKELKGFRKIYLQAGESQQIEFKLSQRDLAYWCCETQSWRAEADEYNFYIGASVADIRLQQTVKVETGQALKPVRPELAAYFKPDPEGFDDAAFSALLGYKVPKPMPVKPFHRNSVLEEVQGHWLGRKVKQRMLQQTLDMLGEIPEQNRLMMEAMIDDMPLRNVSMMSEGKMAEKHLFRLIHILNGDWLKAIVATPVK